MSPVSIASAVRFVGQLPVTERRMDALAAHYQNEGLMVCIVCGCDDEHACVPPGGQPCHWVDPFLCSNCASGFPRGSIIDRGMAW